MIRFEVAARPRPKQRAGRCGRRSFTRDETADAARLFALLALPHQPAVALEGAIGVAFVFGLPTPGPSRDWPEARREAAWRGEELPTARPDVDNLAKLYMDAMTRMGTWWRDDAQVVHQPVTKIYAREPFVGVTFGPWSEWKEAVWPTLRARS